MIGRDELDLQQVGAGRDVVEPFVERAEQLNDAAVEEQVDMTLVGFEVGRNLGDDRRPPSSLIRTRTLVPWITAPPSAP